ncbi:DUF2591 family protein [Klebsiella variicola]|nr:phage protein NinX family protein [Klebsiella variicola]QOV59856.1 DUF2591 family protein [Klebsiella variicola]CEP28689.1 Predicted protein [Klebsiella variicola]
MDYSKLSDFEINKKVFGLIMKDRDWNRQGAGVFDFCNNPEDAWPIIMEIKLTIKPDVYIGGWVAMESKHDETEAIYSAGENPLRAAMIVFLMMQDARNEK